MGAFRSVEIIQLLATGMKVAQMNHRIIANNIANVDTPNYNPIQLDFQKTLRSALVGRGRISLRRTNPRHINSVRFRPDFTSLVFSSKNDYNKVDMDAEIVNLSKNTGRHNLYGSLLVKEFQRIKNMLSSER